MLPPMPARPGGQAVTVVTRRVASGSSCDAHFVHRRCQWALLARAGQYPTKASPGSEPPRCAACVACHGIDGRGGNRWCEVLGCKSMASTAVMDVITEDPLTLVKNAVMGVPTYCETHAQLVRGDLAHTGSIHNAAVKIKAFWAQCQQLNCVRTYGRPRNLAARAAKFLKGCRVPWLTFMSHEDPTFREYVTHYISQPHLCVLGPRGGTHVSARSVQRDPRPQEPQLSLGTPFTSPGTPEPKNN